MGVSFWRVGILFVCYFTFPESQVSISLATSNQLFTFGVECCYFYHNYNQSVTQENSQQKLKIHSSFVICQGALSKLLSPSRNSHQNGNTEYSLERGNRKHLARLTFIRNCPLLLSLQGARQWGVGSCKSLSGVICLHNPANSFTILGQMSMYHGHVCNPPLTFLHLFFRPLTNIVLLRIDKVSLLN